MKKFFTSESVTEGHPDKICDQISDAILDDLLRQDKNSHVAVETSATKGLFFVFGEVSTHGYTDFQSVIRTVVRKLYGARVARSVTVQYGGSMNAQNAAKLLAQSDVDGGLIGGASLKADQFVEIINAANQD